MMITSLAGLNSVGGLPVAKDVISSSGILGGISTSKTFSITVGNNANRILLVWIAVNGSAAAAASSVQYAGVSMTQVGSTMQNGSGDQKKYLYYLLAPATGANNLTYTTDNSNTSTVVSWASLYNVSQSTPLSTADFDNSSSNTITTTPTGVADGYALSCYTYYEQQGTVAGSITSSASQTREGDYWNQDAPGFGLATAIDSETPVAGAQSIGHTCRAGTANNYWSHAVGVVALPA